MAQGGRETRPGEPQNDADALPWLVDKSTVAAFKKYKVLSKRELESRYEVFTEQYAVNLNIEAETEATIARTMVLPASVRYLTELRASGMEELVGEVEPLVKELHFALTKLRTPTCPRTSPTARRRNGPFTCATHAIPAMDDVRDVADRLEKLVADDLWPLPKYQEMLFIKSLGSRGDAAWRGGERPAS